MASGSTNPDDFSGPTQLREYLAARNADPDQEPIAPEVEVDVQGAVSGGAPEVEDVQADPELEAAAEAEAAKKPEPKKAPAKKSGK